MSETESTSPLNKPVFYTSSIIIACLLIFAAALPETADSLFKTIQDVIVTNGSWFYVLTVAIVLLFVVYLGMSRYGEIKLGPDHAVPEFKFTTWLSMLFAAGMGIGLMFFGVAEPLMHFLAPPTAQAESIDAVREAMKTTFFHWGVHAWAIYAVVALILAYFAYRQNLPLTLRSALYPLIGDRIYGWPGHVVDIFAVTSTVFGVSTSLGLGASQVNAGFNYLFGLPSNTTVQIMIMAGVIGLAVISVATGLDKGIRILSETNMVLAILLLLIVLILGPTVFLLQAYMQNTGAYLSDLVRNTFNLFAYDKTDWIGGWTIFYWGWWLAWAPFVGLFIARISYGRTIREFIMGVLLIPSAFTLFCLGFFVYGAIDQVLVHGKDILATMVNEDSAVALFVFLEQFPFSSILSFIAVIMVIVFFVTSCDSGAMVVDMLCSHGRNDTPLWQRIYWAVGVGVVSAVLLYAGGLGALQTMTIASALPFAIVLLIAIAGLLKALRVEAYKRESLQVLAGTPQHNDGDKNWKDRLENIVTFPDESAVRRYMQKIVKPAMSEVGKEFETQQFEILIDETDESLMLTVTMGSDPDFVYAVYPSATHQPEFGPSELQEVDEGEKPTYYRAEVHLSEGGQNYDIMGWSKISVINDVIDQFQKHQHFIHLLK